MANQERFYLLKQGSSAEMPRDIHILMQGQTVWNTWRRSNPTRSLETGEIIRLHLADLSGADLSGTNLHGFDFIHTLLGGANLSNSDLSEAILSYADLGNADLSGANLRRADLSYAHL